MKIRSLPRRAARPFITSWWMDLSRVGTTAMASLGMAARSRYRRRRSVQKCTVLPLMLQDTRLVRAAMWNRGSTLRQENR